MLNKDNVVAFGVREYMGSMLNHPQNLQNVFNVQRWDFAFWSDEACADQVGGGQPRNYVQVFFKDHSLYEKISCILQDRSRLLEKEDRRIGHTLDDMWGHMSYSESAPERAKQNVVTPYTYQSIEQGDVLKVLSETINASFVTDCMRARFDHRALAGAISQ